MRLTSTTLLVALSACNSALAAWVIPAFPLNTAAGWKADGFAAGLTRPRGVTFDSAGNLLVVDRGVGIVAFRLNKDGSAASNHTVLADLDLNHGIALNARGNVLFASSNETAWKWSYNPHTLSVSDRQPIVYGMGNATHSTRTLLVSQKFPNQIVVARGSNGNIDPEAAEMETGSSQVRVFDWTRVPLDGHAWTDGRTLAWGTRNEVGLDEDQAGNVWGVENSADNVFRRGIDVHQTNPAEKVHSFGPALGKQGTYYGYPYCFSVWDPAAFPEDNFKPGDWFVQQPNDTINDAFCNANAVKPKLLIPPHSAPLDMKFGKGHDSNLYVGFHGSWNRQPPTGYKVVTFAGKLSRNGAWSPKVSSTSTNGFKDLLFNTDETACPSSCFRPVGLAWNKKGSILYVTSDATGEIFAVRRA